MYLKELTINGFKSFARKGELEFTTPITAIVGPNGSGKSNVAEAFRFVLGEQSIKSMRGKRGEDLIFNGSESISRSNRASVTISLLNPLRNGTRVFPLDFDEITVERVVNRDGTNEYSINGSKTRLKDVQELLAAANIGSTGHHIISQGEADRILSASPRERREMIEDALGLKVFQYKKAESERKLKKTLENIDQVESLRREVAPHLKFLERQIKKIERALALQEELKVVYAEYLKREDTVIAFHHDRLTKARHSPVKRQKELEEALAVAKEKLKVQEQDDTSDALVELEEKMSVARRERHEISRIVGQLEGQVLFLERQINEKQKRREAEEETPIPRSEFKKVMEQSERSISQALANGDIKILSRAITDVMRSLKVLLTHTFKNDDADGLKNLEHELAELKKKKAHTEKDTEKLQDEEGKLAEEYNELKRKVESESTESREAEREVFSLMNEQREVEQTIDGFDRELIMLERDRQEFKDELQEAVSLLGRGAGMYFEYEVVDTEGKKLPPEELVNENRSVQHGRRRELERMKIRLEELGIGSNDDVLKEYKEVKGRDEFLMHELSDLTLSVEKLEALIQELTNDLNEQFILGIEKIGSEFSKFFVLMFGGGSAELLRIKPKVSKKNEEDLENIDIDEVVEEEPEEGIEIDVKLPNKRVRGLDMLSGGERALTSIALIFAMSQVNPPLFVILDETDAALDEANSRRYGDMISALAEKSQLILITHNRETMGRAGVLYGVTMAGDGISKLLSVKFDEAVAVAK
ncbi:MAG: AAA family ATPase [Candidatus Pacebacteria bacterium]|nr:AAA family ATPase [Candidatus Paceibacterota bacterium]MCF7857010.1 AAA family ATPase [Candidatus Paceibacterota bacterium]